MSLASHILKVISFGAIKGRGELFLKKPNGKNHCSTCTCVNGPPICRRYTCSVLECGPAAQITAPDDCCSHCPPVDCTCEMKTYEVSDTIIQHIWMNFKSIFFCGQRSGNTKIIKLSPQMQTARRTAPV